MKIIAHRGFSARYPENTLESFEKALEENIFGIELDVHQVEDEFFIYHDFYLGKHTDTDVRITSLVKEQIHDLRIKNQHPLPTLAEVAEQVGNKVVINAEVKSLKNIEQFCHYLQSLQRRFGARFIVSSFDHQLLIGCKKFFTGCAIPIKFGALIAHSPLEHALYAVNMKADIAAIDCELVSRAFVEHARKHEVKVWCYTVNYDEQLSKMLEFGIDGIFTDDPPWANARLASLTAST